MNNIFLTNLCNNHCSYCFARGKLKHALADCDERDFLSLDDARVVAGFFEKSRQISFLGGEPTLHPRFEEITTLFVEKGYQIFLFTNGMFGAPVREFLKGQSSVFHVFNVNEPRLYDGRDWETILENLDALRTRVNSLALAIYDPNQDDSHIARLAREYGIKAVKIAVAAPGDVEGNRNIPFDQKRVVAGRLADLVADLSEAGIVTYGECEKLKPCMFDDRSRERVLSSKWIGNLYVNKQCRDGGNIDIGPDLRVWRCYSFPRSMGRKLTDFRTPEEIREYSRTKYDNLFFNYFWLDECYDCDYAADERCEGGCMLRIYRKYEDREAFFYDRFYAELLDRRAPESTLNLYENPTQTELANLQCGDSIPAMARLAAASCDYVITPFLHHFSPLHVTLFARDDRLRFFPSRIRVYGGVFQGSQGSERGRWRKTRSVDPGDFAPFLVYETDFRTIEWHRPEVRLSDADSLAVYYAAADETGRELFCSLSQEGFAWVRPSIGPENLNMVDQVRSHMLVCGGDGEARPR